MIQGSGLKKEIHLTHWAIWCLFIKFNLVVCAPQSCLFLLLTNYSATEGFYFLLKRQRCISFFSPLPFIVKPRALFQVVLIKESKSAAQGFVSYSSPPPPHSDLKSTWKMVHLIVEGFEKSHFIDRKLKVGHLEWRWWNTSFFHRSQTEASFLNVEDAAVWNHRFEDIVKSIKGFFIKHQSPRCSLVYRILSTIYGK